MGSKRKMLTNGLGHLLDREIGKAKRFVDLFSGSGAVVRHAACLYDIEVLAFDLQHYSRVLAAAVLNRNNPLRADNVWADWRERAEARFKKLNPPSTRRALTKATLAEFRSWSSKQTGVITRAYGGHYFSPTQAGWIDSLLSTMPSKEPARTLALASLIAAASQSAAAPGHTAQPFQLTAGGRKFLEASWDADVVLRTHSALIAGAKIYAQRKGKSFVGDANRAAQRLKEGDLVFLDPPYSGVHYSRFYHVLETIARGECGAVAGVGRYPPPDERPRSRYSMKTEAVSALDELLAAIAHRGARAIVTFPDHDCSNGLSGETVRDLSNEYFRVKVKEIDSRFSTLGGRMLPAGSKSGRGGRQYRSELILVLDPR